MVDFSDIQSLVFCFSSTNINKNNGWKKNCKLWEWCRPHTMSKCAIKIDLGCRQKREKDKPSKKQRQ